MRIEWRRFWITFAVTFALCLVSMYFVFDGWAQAFREAFGPAVVWTIIVYRVIGVFKRELNRPKRPIKKIAPNEEER